MKNQVLFKKTILFIAFNMLFSISIAATQAELLNAQDNYQSARNQYEDAKSNLKDAKKELADAQKTLADAQADLKLKQKNLVTATANVATTSKAFTAATAKINAVWGNTSPANTPATPVKTTPATNSSD